MFSNFFIMLGLYAVTVIVTFMIGYNLGCDDEGNEWAEDTKRLVTYYENCLKEKGSE